MTSVGRMAFLAAVGMAHFSSSQAAEINLASSGRTEIVPGEADLLTLVATIATGVLLLLAAIYILFILVSPLLGQESGYGARSGAEDLGVLGRVLNSIDPVESAFAVMNVKEVPCKKRTLCELQRAATQFPLIGSLLRYLSPSIGGLADYKDAQEAGAALEDCSFLFAECPYSILQ